MTQDNKEVNMEDRSEKPSGFWRIPSVWKVIRIFVIFGLILGLPNLLTWGYSKLGGHAGSEVKTTTEESRDDPKVFGGGAPGR